MEDDTRCLWCSQPAVKLCDAILGSAPIDRAPNGSPIWDFDSVYWDCSAPMCVDHARTVGFLCGDDPDTMDLCPAHKEPPGVSNWVTTDREAERLRREIAVTARRTRFRVLG